MFSQAIIGCWVQPELRDFDAFLDELAARGLADPGRLGVTGVSRSDHLSAWLIGHADRFKAVVPEHGLCKMFSMYGVSDAGIDIITHELCGAPHEQPERCRNLSPLVHAYRRRTLVLLISEENDVRYPMEQVEQLYLVLNRNGCGVELPRLANCNHALRITGRPALRPMQMDALQNWFERHVR